MISVIIPVYNAETTLRNTVVTIENQSYRDFEIVLVNDGSKDNSKKICDELIREYDNIILVDQINLGASAARNAGIRNSTGEWITFVDADDELYPWSLKEMVAAADNDTDVVVGCNSRSCGNQNDGPEQYTVEATSFVKATLGPRVFSNEVQAYLGKRNIGVCVGPPWGKLIRKEFLIKNDIWFPEGQVHHEDTVFCLQMYLRLQSVKLLAAPVYKYKDTENSVSVRFNSDKINNMVAVSQIAMHLCENNNEVQPAVQVFVTYRLLDCFWSYLTHTDNTDDFIAIRNKIREISKKDVFISMVFMNMRMEMNLTLKDKILMYLIKHKYYMFATIFCLAIRTVKKLSY